MNILGLSLSHDSSAAVLDHTGNVIGAIAEERITRQKNYTGLPTRSVEILLNQNSNISTVVIGSHRELSGIDASRLLSPFDDNPSNPIGAWRNPWPGRGRSTLLDNSSPKEAIEVFFKRNFPVLSNASFVWINHHNSHLGCALGAAPRDKLSLLVSLDGFGDGESGALSVYDGDCRVRNLSRISALDSLGGLYSAVTERYNFSPNRHEGKITGLAAFGSYSHAVEILASFVRVKNGRLRILSRTNLKKRLLGEIIRRVGFHSKIGLSLSEIVDLAESQTSNYADLAFAVQKVLEDSVVELIEFYLLQTNIRVVSLAGGVFSNVRLNQKISEMRLLDSAFVFPNMGDGGISVGGVWYHLTQSDDLAFGLSNEKLYDSMYLAPAEQIGDSALISLLDPYKVEFINDEEALAVEVASRLHEGQIIAIHQGKMEFGPRSLGNRSILADPRNPDINHVLNKRLNRTEFMPFAPIVRLEDFHDCFEIPQTQQLSPFYYMTMTCNVRFRRRKDFPAVVHIDGTARPQVVSKESNRILHKILSEWNDISGIPVLINTSFNSHEEPIIMNLSDSLKALDREIVDVLLYDNLIITKK